MVIVWYKRDLRITDHEPLVRAYATGEKVLPIYSFEPLWTQDAHYSARHINFIKESLQDLRGKLAAYATDILITEEDILPLLERLHELVPISGIHSHQETGLALTYQRDRQVLSWCRERKIPWREYVSNGVFRGIKDRTQWKEHWLSFMEGKTWDPDWSQANFFTDKKIETYFNPHFKTVDLRTPQYTEFQKGGSTQALKYLDSFFQKRIGSYNRHYSKPETSRLHSSRLSPYLAWGNLSTRQVWHYALGRRQKIRDKRNLTAFLSRLRWQAHFIQKLEMETQMEFHSINRGYHGLDKKVNPEWQQAWKKGVTGIPMVDAAMRCLFATGFVNFRLRALLASFFTHLMWQPWQDCAAHLAHYFLDFEPGIHYPQLNMQSGETGIHTIRVYNPIKNGKEHDTEGEFIKKWVHELAHIPKAYIHEPWNMPEMEKQFLDFQLGRDYPEPILDVQRMWTYSTERLWALRKKTKVRIEGQRILAKHTLPGRPVWDNLE